MTEQEIKCYEQIASFLYNKGKCYIMDGNSCDDILAVLCTIEEIVLQELETTSITAFIDDLDDHNKECQEYGG